MDRESATAAYDGSIPEKGLRTVIEEANEAAKITRDAHPSDVSDITVLREVQQEFG